MAKIKEVDEILEITGYSFPNNAVAVYEDKEINLKNRLIGEKVKCTYKKTRRGYEGRVVELIEASPLEIEPKCKDFGVCGGCTFQNVSYEDELKIKEKMVLDLFAKSEVKYDKYSGIRQSPIVEGYRNKMEYSFGDSGLNSPLSLGMRKRQSTYETVTADYCNIVDDDYNKILDISVDFFRKSGETFHHKLTKEGSLRHLLVRKGKYTGEILIGIVTTSSLKCDLTEYKNEILASSFDGEIVGVLHIVNDSLADIVKADTVNVLFGRDYIYDKLFDFTYKISLFSFFQTNTKGAESLYSIVKDFVGDKSDSLVFDLYSGTGTIAQVISDVAKKVIGIELVEEAVIAGRESLKNNNIENVELIAGDVFEALDNLNETPDFIIVDPPRDGLNKKALEKIMSYNVDNIIYVSCKPSSLIRDLELFTNENYKVQEVVLQDMFPRTYHVETVVLLGRKNLLK